MSTPAPSPQAAHPAPGPARVPPADAPPRADGARGEDLDLEEDIAPNLGGEDQMQDA